MSVINARDACATNLRVKGFVIENWTSARVSKFHKRECGGISYLPLKLSVADIVERAAQGKCSFEKGVVNLTKTGSS